MEDRKLFRRGMVGTSVAAVCCFTPVLVIAFGFAGLSAFVGWLDYGLFPMLFVSMGFVGYALYLLSGTRGPSPNILIALLVITFSVGLILLEFKYALRISIAAAALLALYAGYLRWGAGPSAA